MSMKVPFTKMHGLGNCYIYLDGFKTTFDEALFAPLSAKVSNIHTGIGSDGLIAILPSENGVARMRIFNKDGSEAKNCGNGLRCLARYVYENGYVQETSFPIETASGMVTAQIHLTGEEVTSVTVDMGKPILTPAAIPATIERTEPIINEEFELLNTPVRLTAVSMGNPHAIILVDDIEQAPIQELGRLLADGHRLFPEGVNVGFIQPSLDGGRYRVWERGSGITQACGTGACAAAVALVLNNKAEKDKPIILELDGGTLTITWESENGHIMMSGPAVTVCQGEFYADQKDID